METESKNTPISKALSSSVSNLVMKEYSKLAISQWEEYLIGKKVPAKRFLAKIEKDGITYPDESTKERFAIALTSKPVRIARLILLLQASISSNESIRRIVQELNEAGIKRLSVVSFKEPLDAATFEDSILSWLAGIRKKPIKQTDLNILILLLHFGWYRNLVEHNTIIKLLTVAVTKPNKRRSKKEVPEKPAPSSLGVFLAAATTVPVFSALLSLSESIKSASSKLDAQIQSQTVTIANLTAEQARLNQNINELNAQLAEFKAQDAANKDRIIELEKNIAVIRDGYQHKLDDLRGRMRGMMQMQLTRWLQTALDASRSDPPWNKAIQERLEDALKLIEKELQWLQPSV